MNGKSFRSKLRLTAACLCVAVVASINHPGLEAQRPRGQAELKEIHTAGKIKRIGKGVIEMVSQTGHAIQVAIDPKVTKQDVVVRVKGAAVAKGLRQGQYVRFQGVITRRGLVQGTLDRLAIITPSKDAKPGVYAQDDNQQLTPSKVGASEDPQMVIGQIRRFRKGQLIVAAGRTNIKADVAENAYIEVDSADYSLARIGDAIEVEGSYKSFPYVAGKMVTITLSSPVGAPPGTPNPQVAKAGGDAAPGERPAGRRRKGRILKIN